MVTESVYATTVPILVGTCRVHSKLLWFGGFTATPAPTSGGKGLFGGKGAQQFEYFASVVAMLAQGPCTALINVWDSQGKLENLSSQFNYTILSGGSSVSPLQPGDPNIQHDLGVTQTKSYSVVANDFGSGTTQTLTGTQQVPMVSVSGTPGAGEYNFNAATNTYTFSAADAGANVAIHYSSVFSLYYYEQTQAGDIPASGPFQITTDNASFFFQDKGVTYVSNGVALTPVGGSPGPGQYHQGSGTYTFNAADAGKYVYINYTYTSSDPNLTSSSYLNLTFFNGAKGQAPWSYLTSKFPSAAFGYTGICYVGASPMALGESAVMPNYNYEVVGQAVIGGSLDADLTSAIALILTDPLCGVNFPADAIGDWSLAQAYWRSNGYNISQALQSTETAASLIGRWVEAGNTAAVMSEGQLKLIPYGDTTTVGSGFTYQPPTNPVATLTWDDLLPLQTQNAQGKTIATDPIEISRKMPQDRFNYVQVQWTNRANDYNNELTTEMNDAFMQAYGVRIESPQTWEFLTTQTAATWALNLRLKRNLYIANTYKLRLPFTFAYLEPMDMLVLPTGEPIRPIEINESADGSLEITAENFTYGSADVTIYPKQVADSYQPNLSQAIPGNAVPIFLQNTTVQANFILNKLQVGAVGQTPNWGGCNVYVSLDNVTYTQIGSIKSTGIIGLLTANIPSSTDPDTTSTLSVDLSLSLLTNPAAEMVSVTQQSADNFVSLCAIVDQSGLTNELIAYENSTLTGAGRYDLTYLRRGVYATPIAAHTTGAFFTFLGPNYDFLDYQYYQQYVGQSLFVKLQSFNLMGGQVQDLSQLTPYQLFISGQGSSVEDINSYLPSTTTTSISGAGTITNISAAFDRNFTTAGVLDSGNVGSAIVIFDGFPSYVPSGSALQFATIYISFETTITGSPTASNCTFRLSKDGGINFFQIGPTQIQGATTGTITYPQAIGSGDNLNLFQIRALCQGNQMALSIKEVWIQVTT